MIPVFEVVDKLIGPTIPTGETEADEMRYKNLVVMIDLAEKLLWDINYIAHSYADSSEHSVSKAGKRAKQFMDDIQNGELP